jgi:hypothetical protein
MVFETVRLGRLASLFGRLTRKTRGRAIQLQPRGVTSIAYLPGRGSNLLASGGCADAKLKVWDMRYIESESKSSGCKDICGTRRTKLKDEDILLVDPYDQGVDVSKQSSWNKRCV